MKNIVTIPFSSFTRSDSLRIRTLILLRWLAIFGQTIALIIVNYFLDISLDVALCALAISASTIFNVISSFIFPINERLSERNALLTLIFDLFQLAILLYLTGGLSNPFVVLILTPVVISATMLTLRSTMLIGVTAIFLLSSMTWLAHPLVTNGGEIIEQPKLLVFGTWVALVISIVFLGIYARRVTTETFSLSEALTATQLALEREQQLTALGGVVAAAAHELGTPLATIKLTAAELADELEDDTDPQKDAELIAEQADRCRDILKGMGRRGKDDTLLHTAPISAIIEEAAEPHLARGKNIQLLCAHSDEQPEIYRYSEVIHGLRNLIQNAVDFAEKNVWIDINWDESDIHIRVGDDGPGYPTDLIGRIGTPFMRKRSSGQSTSDTRKGYDGMGLGLFIAKTLLERTGARLAFANGPKNKETSKAPSGAIVELVWNRKDIEADKSKTRSALGENKILKD